MPSMTAAFTRRRQLSFQCHPAGKYRGRDDKPPEADYTTSGDAACARALIFVKVAISKTLAQQRYGSFSPMIDHFITI